jgi:hypothetical protein
MKSLYLVSVEKIMEVVVGKGEQQFFEERGYSEPIRCKDCRNKKKAQQRTSGFR